MLVGLGFLFSFLRTKILNSKIKYQLGSLCTDLYGEVKWALLNPDRILKGYLTSFSQTLSPTSSPNFLFFFLKCG